MVDPLSALLVAAAAAVLGCALLWPDRGFFWRWLRYHRITDRVLIEDALKHLHDCEYRQRTPTVQSLCGALATSGDRAARLLARLEAQGLVRSEGGSFSLTDDGRNYALRIIRVHRLWERHLSEETGLNEADWHHEADRHEHLLSRDEADALAARMGHPLYDPHGDPIPTAAGDIAPRQSRPLTDLPPGQPAMIVHLEDEPDAVYAQLVAEGLHPGMRVQVDEVSRERIRFRTNDEGHVLAPVVAANVSVLTLPEPQETAGPFASLALLQTGQTGAVVGISRACRGLERHRLMDLGLVPGTLVKAEMVGLGGEVTAYRIRGALIALRKEQADWVHVDRRRRVRNGC